MNKHLQLTLVLICFSGFLTAQTFIPIPDTISGSSIDLMIDEGTHEFYEGTMTNTIGYNGNLLGPTIILDKGQEVTLNVHNALNDSTTTHWHGLHVAPMNDGSPHNLILPDQMWSPSFEVMDKAATYWYHPHLHGKTMEQVLMGASGMIIVRDEEEANLALPRTYGVDDFPLILQWKTFDASNQIVMADEVDNAAMVNGVINGQLDVPAQMVRFRVLNGSSHRYFYFAMNDNRNFKVIAGDESLLNSPVIVNKLMISPGERFEVVIDFSGQEGGTYFLQQLGTELPAGYPAGPPDQMGMGESGPLDNTDFNLLQFNVTSATSNPILSVPSSLTSNNVTSTVGAGTKTFNLQGSPMMSMTNFTINGEQFDMDEINFYTSLDSVMIWSLTNQSMMPHPWHIHGNYFYVLTIDGAAPPAYMAGRKDVVTVAPMGGTVTLVMKYEDFWDADMPYMYHCHILSHEDNGMMGQFIVSESTIGVSESILSPNEIVSFPNPTTNDWIIKGNSVCSAISLKLLDAEGKIILMEKIASSSSQFEYRIEAEDLSSGVYFLQLECGGASQQVKLVKE